MKKKFLFLIFGILFIGFVFAVTSTLTIYLNSPTNNTFSTNLTQNFQTNSTSNVTLVNSTLYIWNGSGIQVNTGADLDFSISENIPHLNGLKN